MKADPSSVIVWVRAHPDEHRLHCALGGLATSKIGTSIRALKQWVKDHPAKAMAIRSKNGKSSLNRRKLGSPATGKSAAGQLNFRCLYWSLREPCGKTHEFKNLSEWVRMNEELFNPEDVIWQPIRPGGRTSICRAIICLGMLRPDRRCGRGSWKGWTWYSIPERRFNDGQDLLQRQPQ